MYEYEFRIKIVVSDFQTMQQILKNFQNKYTYIVKYVDCFRNKTNREWELKKILRKTMVFHTLSSNWLMFVESKEKPFDKWKREDYKSFYQYMAFRQSIYNYEYRYEVQLDENAKLYGYSKNLDEFGLVFELEICNSKMRYKKLPIIVSKLNMYNSILQLFYKQTYAPYILYKCIRKSVITTNKHIKNAVKSFKYDGIFGHIYSYKNYIYEEWEDCKQFLFQNETLGDGFVYGAERLNENKVIILYVAQVRGVSVYNIHDILLKFLPTIVSNAPLRYNIQYYYKDNLPCNTTIKSDGFIFHTNTDKIYKKKFKHTLDLLYENGFFVTQDGLIECHENMQLENGTVYECDLDLKVIRPRPDRFISNTPKQLEKILQCSGKNIKYSLTFNKTK